MESLVEVKLVEYYNEHWYKVVKNEETNYYPSVTTKLGVVRKPFLEQWRGDLGNRECDMRVFEASQRGTRIHHAWYVLTTGGMVIYNHWRKPTYLAEEIEAFRDKYEGNIAVIQHQDEMVDVWKLQQFMGIVKPRIIASELVVYSDKNQEAGTIDNVFEIEQGSYPVNGREPLYLEGGIYIADLKTGNTFSEDAYLQMAAYASMYTEMYGKEVTGTLGLHTAGKNRKGIEGFTAYCRPKASVIEDYSEFRSVSEVWLSKNKNAQPRKFEFPSMLTLRAF